MKGLSISLRTLILTATILSVTILHASTESNVEHANWIEYDNGKYLSIFYTPTEEGEFWVKKLEEVKSSDSMFGDIFNPAGTKYIVTIALFAGNFDSYKIIKKEFYDDDMNLLQSNDIGRNVTSDKSIFPPSVKLQYIKYLYNNKSDDFINIGKVSNPKLLDFELSIFRDTKIIYVDEQHKNCYLVSYLLSYTPPAKINQRTIPIQATI